MSEVGRMNLRVTHLLSLTVCLAVALVGGMAADVAMPIVHGSGMSDCPTFLDGVQLGTVESSLLTEISGVTASRKNAGVLWVHNDSGDSARIFAMTLEGRHLGIYNLVGAGATDWEDIAIGPGPLEGEDYIYVGDTGDNARSRSSVTVYRVAEPLVDAGQDPVSVDVEGVDAFPMQYPGADVYDSETLLVDPAGGDFLLVTKDRAGEGVARVFRKPSPHTPDVMATLELVATLSLSRLVTGGDVSPAGDAVLLRLDSGYYWPRATGTDLWEAFSATPCLAPLATEPQGEALAFAADGLGYYTVSEGASQPIYFYERDESTVLVPSGSTWRYLDDGSDQGTGWREPAFDDSAWASGPAQLGYGDGDEATVVSYGGDPNNKHITTYLRHSFDVEDTSVFESLTLRILRDDGAAVHLNGAEVFRTNMPDGAIDHQTLAASTVYGSDESTFFTTAIDPGLLSDGSNTLAVEIHQAGATSSDISFDLELRGVEGPTPTPTPTGAVDPDVTTVEIRDEVRVPDVKRLGINIGGRSQWGAAQILKNLIDNPGFEPGVYEMAAHAAEGSTGARFEQDFWDTSWNNDLYGIGQPEDFWNGADYEIVYGPAKGQTGTVADFTHENNRYTYYLGGDSTPVNKWDVLFVRQQLDATLGGAPGRWDTMSADPTEIRPGSPGQQSMHLTAPDQAWKASYEFFMDSLWRDGDRDAGKLLLVEGNWRLEFWAKGNVDGAQLRARFFREGEANFIDETVSLTTDWQKYEFDAYIPEGADSPGPYTDEEYHPLLVFAFYVPDVGDEAWVDDAALYRSDDTNPTVFTDPFVNRLKELSPGVLRDWNNRQFGNTLDNQLAVPWARKTVGYQPDERTASRYGYSLHEFLELCQEVGAEPRHVIPPASSPADLINLIEYLAGPADGLHPYADRRAALGQTDPWTDIFDTIHLEFGNELWGAGTTSDPFFGASLRGGIRLGAIAHDRFEILKSSPYYDPAKFNLIIGGQTGVPSRQTEIEGHSSNHDTIALSPYFGALDPWDSDEVIYYPLFAVPFDWASTGKIRHSKDNIDSFGQGTGLAIYEINFHNTSGPAPLDIRNDYLTGLGGGIALPLHMLVYMRELGITNQAAFNALGFATDFKTNEGEWVRLWGMLRDLEATGRKRPTWLGVELVNKAIQGDMLETVQAGANPSWVQAPINGVETQIEVNYVQSFAFRDGDSYSVILFNLGLDESQQVRLDLPVEPASQATRHELSSTSIHDDNEDAENVSIQTTQVTDFANGYELTLPPHSINVITWRAQPCYDVTGDSRVDVVDVQAVAGRWGASRGNQNYADLYDLNDDGIIDVVDITEVAKAWRTTCS